MLNFYEAKSGAMPINREEWTENGDEEINGAIEEAARNAKVGSIPSTLKAVIKFGYEEGMKAALAGEDFDAYIAGGIYTHSSSFQTFRLLRNNN